MKSKLNCTAKQAFFTARKRDGDAKRLSQKSGYSVSHIINVMEGRRNVPQLLANEMFNISRRRLKNSKKYQTIVIDLYSFLYI